MDKDIISKAPETTLPVIGKIEEDVDYVASNTIKPEDTKSGSPLYNDPFLVESQESIIWKYISQLFTFLRKMYHETKVGPWNLGVIDTTKYDRHSLDSGIIELLNEIFDFQGQQYWIISQLSFFLQPLIYGIGGPVINRSCLFTLGQY